MNVTATKSISTIWGLSYATLPMDITKTIFSWVPAEDQIAVGSVCKRWRKFSVIYFFGLIHQYIDDKIALNATAAFDEIKVSFSQYSHLV